jgi:glycosyltransferase involved in cell wall biosynthesis
MSDQRPLRVLILNYEYPPMGGGAGHASSRLAGILAASGCRVDVVTSGLKGQPPVARIDGVRVFRVRSLRRSIQDCGLLGAATYVACAQPVVKRLLRDQRYDVLHYFFGLPTGALSLCTPGADRVPSVISLRGSDVPGYDAGSASLRLAHALLRPLTRRIWRSANVVVANSRGLRDLAQPLLPGKPIGVIPNAIHGEAFSPNGAASHRNGSADAIRLLAVSRLIGRKGLEDLFRAMTILKDDRVTLTVQGWGRDGDRLRALAVSLGIDRRVTFAGFKPRDLLPAVYQAADIFVLPSHSESCAMALLEAMACGLPIVATSVGGTAELVQDGVNGCLVPPESPQALAGALARLIAAPALRRAMGARNVQLVRDSYTWPAMASRYLNVYRQAIARRHGHSEAADDRA